MNEGGGDVLVNEGICTYGDELVNEGRYRCMLLVWMVHKCMCACISPLCSAQSSVCGRKIAAVVFIVIEGVKATVAFFKSNYSLFFDFSRKFG